ncbi:MAG: hypothetical protein E7513_03750 [Ruminococcaceae bacterium]|nr:hypothetical protein [Oscillospiraceae bacterium]
MKRIISFLLALTVLISVAVVSTSAAVENDPYYSWNEGAISVTDAVTQWEKENHPVQKHRYYFLMPNGSNGELGDNLEYARSWYNEFTETAGIYWWDSGVADPPDWIGYIAEKCTGLGEDDIYYADVPAYVTNIIWNNGINGGEDKTQDVYYKAAQTANIGTEYYDPGESDNYPNGTENFDNMIYVIEPELVNVGDFSLKQTCGGEWYYYYGSGCYGFTPGGKAGSDACLRDDHTHIMSDDYWGDVIYPEKPSYPPDSDDDWYNPWEDEEDPFKDAPTKTGEIHFDVKSTGWKNVTKVYAHVWAYDDSGEWPAWQSKAELCDYNTRTGIATYDLSKTGNEFKVGKPYVVIFSDYSQRQTHWLLFSTDCIGDTAYCSSKEYENPYDSLKTALAAFWRGQDETKWGPVKVITSIGNVVGTCIPSTENPQEMFEDFLKWTLENARAYSGKTDQQILDDTAKALGLKKDNVTKAIENTRVTVSWKAAKSKLSSGYVEFETSSDKGDTDGDGKVTVMDATAIQFYKAELSMLSSSQIKRADVDGDGKATVMDATQIQRFLAELVDSL